jgi:phage FluMu protein Com
MSTEQSSLLTETEEEKYTKFLRKHRSKCGTNKIILIIDHSNGVGQYTKIKCPKCKKTKDITEYKCW